MSPGWRHWSVAFAVALLLHLALLAVRWGWNERDMLRSVVTLDLQTPDNLPKPVPVSLPSSLAFAWQLGAQPDATQPMPETPPPKPARGGELSATLGGQSLGLEALTGPAVAAGANLARSQASEAPPEPVSSTRAPAPEPRRASAPQPRSTAPSGGVSAQIAARTPATPSEPPANPAATVEPPVEPGPAPPDQVRLVREEPEEERDDEDEREDDDTLSQTADAREPPVRPADAQAQASSALNLADSLSVPSAPEDEAIDRSEPESDATLQPDARTAAPREPAASVEPPVPAPTEPVRREAPAFTPPPRTPDLDQAIDQALAQTVPSSEPLDFPPPSTPTPSPSTRPAPASADVDRALSETLDRLARVQPETRSPPVEYRLPAPQFEPDPADQAPARRAPSRGSEISRALTGVESQYGRAQGVPDLPPPAALAESVPAQTRAPSTATPPQGRVAPQPPAQAIRQPRSSGTGSERVVAGRVADPRYDPNGRPGAYSVDANDFFSRIADHIFRANDRFIGRLPPDAPRVFLDVRFTIDRLGRVMTVNLLRSSGDARLDQAAKEVVWRASPMPALAQDMVSETLELTFPVVVAR